MFPLSERAEQEIDHCPADFSFQTTPGGRNSCCLGYLASEGRDTDGSLPREREAVGSTAAHLESLLMVQPTAAPRRHPDTVAPMRAPNM